MCDMALSQGRTWYSFKKSKTDEGVERLRKSFRQKVSKLINISRDVFITSIHSVHLKFHAWVHPKPLLSYTRKDTKRIITASEPPAPNTLITSDAIHQFIFASIYFTAARVFFHFFRSLFREFSRQFSVSAPSVLCGVQAFFSGSLIYIFYRLKSQRNTRKK